MADITNTSGSPTGNIYVDSLIWGSSWAPNLGQGVSLTWKTVTYASTLYGDANGQSWTATEKGMLREALDAWASVANITFTESGAAETDLDYLKVSKSTMVNTLGKSPKTAAFHEVPDDESPALTGVFRTDIGEWTSGLFKGGRGFLVMMHEIGHGLGLAHPHDGGGDGQTFPGVGSSGSLGTNQLNQGIWTIMSYNDGWITEPSAWPKRGYELTPMALDIAAIQTIYGKNMSYHAGADAYFMPVANADGVGWTCIWDAGGNDTIWAISATTSVSIDLREAPLTGAKAGGYVSHVLGVSGGFTIANGVVIENAVGGSANDTILGNAAGNELLGLAGNDSLNGAGGHDHLSGGDGNDTLLGDTGDDSVEGGDGQDSVAGGDGNDSLDGNLGNDTVDGGAGNDTILGGDGLNHLLGGSGNDLLIGGADNDTIEGSTGNDFASGLDGNDSMSGATGNDNLSGGNGNDTVSGGSGKDTLFGSAGNDLVDGGTENDSINGGDSNDTVVGADGADSVDGGLGDDWLFGNAGDDTILGSDGLDTIAGGAGADSINGGQGSDQLFGDLGSDRIYGLDGDDVLYGNDDNDTLIGGLGADSLLGGAHDDSLAGGDGADTLNGGSGTDTLLGGTGADRFVFTVANDSNFAAGVDQISDFNLRSGDRIDLSGIDAVPNTLFSNEAFHFLATGPGRGGPAVGDLWVQAPIFGSGIYIYGELDGDADRELTIYVSNVTALTELAFIL